MADGSADGLNVHPDLRVHRGYTLVEPWMSCVFLLTQLLSLSTAVGDGSHYPSKLPRLGPEVDFGLPASPKPAYSAKPAA